MTTLVSMVANAKSTETTTVEVQAVLADIRNGRWRREVEPIRTEYARAIAEGRDPKTAVAEMKKGLAGVLWSGTFSRRANAALVTHSGILCADLDHLDVDGKVAEARAKLQASPHLVAVFLSPTGSGIKALFRVPPDPAKHRGSFAAVAAHVKDLTGLDIDPACKDVARLCFVSYDPDLWLRDSEAEELAECTQGYKDTKAQGHNNTDGCSLVALSPCRLVYTREQAVEIATPREKGTNHRLLYKLAGALWAFEETIKTALSNGELRECFKLWHTKSTLFLNAQQTEEEYFLEFMDAWNNIDHPLPENEVDVAWQRTQTAPTPPEATAAGLTSPNVCKLIALCREMQILNGDKPFYLSPYSVMKLFGQNTHSTAAKWLGGLCSLKILAVVERGDFGKKKATSYRFNFKTP